jgi:hypothetical protein
MMSEKNKGKMIETVVASLITGALACGLACLDSPPDQLEVFGLILICVMFVIVQYFVMVTSNYIRSRMIERSTDLHHLQLKHAELGRQIQERLQREKQPSPPQHDEYFDS